MTATTTHRRLHPLALSLAFAAAAPALADFRCGSRLVTEGMRGFEIIERCGDPDYSASYPLRVLGDHRLPFEEHHWYYNPGSQSFVRRMVLRNDEVIAIERLGRGMPETTLTRQCQPGDLALGQSEFEVQARCGQPLARRFLWQGYLIDNQQTVAIAPGYAPALEWVFEFGAGQFRRAVILRNGQVTHIEVLQKAR